MRVLAMAADDFSKERRGTFLSRIATEEWDVIICAHTSFGCIETGPVAREFIQIEVNELRVYLGRAAAQARGHAHRQAHDQRDRAQDPGV